MATDTTRVSSYAQFEGYKDSAGTMYPYASAVNNLVTGLTTAVNASSLVNLVSGLTTAVNASSLVNLVSGLTTGVAASALTANISGLTIGAAILNTVQYAATAHMVAYGSATITGTGTFAHGLATVAYVQVTPLVSALCWATVSGGANITVTLTSGGAAATGAVHWMAINA